MTEKEQIRELIEQHRRERPLPRKEIERFEKALESSGYKERFETLEKQVAELLSILKEKEVVESNNQ